ncbi:S9 family peptidase [Portibacter marinus]|uniref:S9 family peptidase n=1 Tax=Portibacter marinus TaxID=2898660 RepID=UPI001F21DA88|nr:prolyl oligopeptidase family serine peptidase [Portibacter marinus]
MKKGLFCSLFALIATISYNQSLTYEDYDRAVSFMRDHYHNKTAFNLYTDVNWQKDQSAAIFKEYDEAGQWYHKVDLKSYEISKLFDHDRLAALLQIDNAGSIEISEIKMKEDSLYFRHADSSFVLSLENYDLSASKIENEKQVPEMQSISPDGQWMAFVKDFNLYIRSTTDSTSYPLSSDGFKDYEYGTYYGWFDKMEGEDGQRPERFWVDWSPDSKFIRTNLVDLRNADKMYMLDYSQDDKFRPDLYAYYRGSPGDTNMVMVTAKFYDVETKKEVNLKLPARTHINSMGTEWTEQSGVVIATDRKRGFQEISIAKIDLNKAQVEELFKETSPTNIDDFEFRYLENEGKIAFLSQRSGWRQMYYYDLGDNTITSLTQGEFVINDIVHLDEDQKAFYILASGKDPEMNPYHQQLYKVLFSGELILLTPEKLHHQIDFAPDGLHFSDNYSTVAIPTKTVIRKADSGEVKAELTEADVDDLKSKGWTAPMEFSLIGKDKKTTIYGAIWRPTHFDPDKTYPIIDHSYTGPHTQVFPKSFDRALNNQALAELGFIVMMVDGLGTIGRSKEFANHSYKNMGNNLEDHVLAIKHLGTKYRWIDTDKVGIFGHSAGGYDAGHAMMAFPDFYKVAVSSSADHDFRMEKAWWPEMYMGWPVDSTYHEVSNITMASNLKGKLLLVHGNMDDNVNVSATYKLAEALVKADKEFDMLIFPSQRHGYQGKHRDYFTKKRWNYFVEHLLEAEPIWDFKLD